MLNTDAIRADFPLLGAKVNGAPLAYLDNAATTQKPQAVLDRLLAFYTESNSNVHRGIHRLSELASAHYEAARETVRRFINARHAHEVIFTAGTTDAINMLADGFAAQTLDPGDEIIVSAAEHHSNLIPWQVLCARQQVQLRIWPFEDDGLLRPAALADLLTARTRLVAVTHVSNVLGRRNPLAEIVRVAHAHDVPVLVDAAQSIQHVPLDVQALDCDFLAFSGHKAYAETGIGVLYGREAWLERLPPRRYGGGMVAHVDAHRATFADLPYRLEAGTPNIGGAVSLAAALDYLDQLGRDAIAAHEQSVMDHALQRLTELDGVAIYGRGPGKCGAISFNLGAADAFDVAAILDRLGVAVRSGTHCAAPALKHFGVSHSVRASLALYNTVEDVDRLIDGLHRARQMLL